MSTEINFTENQDLTHFDCSGLPFYSETRDLKTDEQYDFFIVKNEDVKKAADEYYEEAGEEGWCGFMEGVEWYNEQLKNKKWFYLFRLLRLCLLFTSSKY